jgi:uncharacterized protein (TIRG00374 family)
VFGIPTAVRRWTIQGVGLVILALVVVFLVVPQMRTALGYLEILGHPRTGWVLLGVALEAGSFVAYGLFTRSLLPEEGRPSWHWLLRLDMLGAGLTHILPGGGATASGLRFKLLRDNGVQGSDAALASVVQGLGSAIVVNVLLLAGVLVVLPERGGDPRYVTGAITAAVLVSIAVGGCLVFTRAEDRVVGVARRLGERKGRSDRLELAVRRVSVRLSALAGQPAVLARAAGWAAANWLLDAASLWVFLIAFGHRVDLGGILVAFGLANTLAILPITPGGLGVIEGVLVPALVGFGTPQGMALLGVLTWRLFNFWAPIPAAGASWLSIRLGRRRNARRLAALPPDAAADPVTKATDGMALVPSS